MNRADNKIRLWSKVRKGALQSVGTRRHEKESLTYPCLLSDV